MGFFSGILGTAINIVTTPIAMVADAGRVLSGEEATITVKHVENTVDKAIETVDDLLDLEL